MASPDKSERDEFAIIARHFAPLAGTPAARGLLDDAALIEHAGAIVATTDAIVEGVHFLADDPLDAVARKALRVNLSDLAAKGARPLGYLLTLCWPAARRADEIAALAQGLAADQAEYAITLWGGDTVATPGPLMLSVTMLGAAGARTPARSDARAGDEVWVSGTIGDAGLGLRALRGEEFAPAEREALIQRYRLPRPRTDLAAAVAAHAAAAMDVSDGLIADAGKIAAASGLALAIEAERVPLSPAAQAWLARQADRGLALAFLASCGDDYEILLTAPPGKAAALAAAGFTRIGAARAGQGVVFTLAGAALAAGPGGYAHALGAGPR
ncbi:MAG: thiamine-phosphate kinase [Hyphomonadaceae bacterium]